MLGSLFHRLTDFSVLRVKLITSDLAAILPSAMGLCTANIYYREYCFQNRDLVYIAGISLISPCSTATVHCNEIIGRNPIEANANTGVIQLLGNPVAYTGNCFTLY